MDNNIDALLLNINDMTKSVNKQIEDSEEELRTQTRLLTFHDKLISDEMLLSLPPDVLQNSLPDDEFDEFLEKYPDYVTKHELKKDETRIEEQNENQENTDQIDQEPKQSTEISDETILDSPQDKTEEDEEQIVNENIVITKSLIQNKKENNWKNNLVTAGIISTIVIILKILLSF